MTQDLPFIGFGTDDDGKDVAVVGTGEYGSLAAFIAAAPFVTETPHLVFLAGALNQFGGHGDDYMVIEDCTEYKREFLETYAQEEEMEIDLFNASIADFDLPDFDRLAEPQLIDGTITFCVNHLGMDVPYRVTGPADGSGKLDYTPL